MKFIVNEPVTFARGRFGLTQEQAAPRRHALREVEAGVFEPVAEIQFKKGERVQILSPLPKALVSRLQPVDADAAVEVEGAVGQEQRRRRRA